jgi:hypothetical protein
VTESGRYTVGEVAVVAIVTTGAFLASFPHRSDYAGHYVAGFGATLGLLAAYAIVTRRSFGAATLPLTFLAIALGYVTESTFFRVAIFDPVDFFVQSAGAAVAAWVLMDRRLSLGPAIVAVVFGGVLVGAGFFFAFA